jgi:hypothetical protein
MPKPGVLTKAELIELTSDLTQDAPGAKPVRVQFNPESLKVTYANQLATDEKSTQTGTAAMQFVGKGSTKLAVQLWFDVNHPSSAPEGGGDAPRDVRDFTTQVAYFITPKESSPGKYVIPGVRFQWGSFSFTGVLESLDESLELFSNDGRPLRASLSLGLIQQKIVAFNKGQGITLPKTREATGNNAAGTVALTTASAGSTVQSLADTSGKADGNWQDVASANGIENPRLLEPGQLLNVNATARVGI